MHCSKLDFRNRIFQPHYAIGVLAAFWTIERVAAFWS